MFKRNIVTPWAQNGRKRTIPDTPSNEVGAASLELGFPPATFTPEGAGGVPPSGEDFNGAFNLITATLQEVQAGTQAQYDKDFCAAIGGYQKGAILLSSDGATLWKSLADGNTTDPDSADAKNWVKVIDIATQANIKDGAAGKLIDAAGLLGAFDGGDTWQELPSGLIIQWGRSDFTSIGDYNRQVLSNNTYYTQYRKITLPKALVRGIFNVSSTLICAPINGTQTGFAGFSTSASTLVTAGQSSKTDFTVAVTSPTLGASVSIHWIAIGF